MNTLTTGMQAKNHSILWLASWYPNKNDRFDGDFIQRHARAAAVYHDVHVIFVVDADMQLPKEEEWNYTTGLTEQIIYFKKKKGFTARIRKQLTWRNVFQKAIKHYIDKNGLPDIVHVHVPWKAGLIALWIKRKYGIDFIVTEHWTIYNDGIPSSFEKKTFAIRKLMRRIFDSSVGIIPVSINLSETLRQIFSVKTIAVINNVVDSTLFHFSEKKYSRFTFIHVSNMSPMKNVTILMTAFKIFLQKTNALVNLVFVGNKIDDFVKYAEGLTLLDKSIFFRGEVSYREVAEEMQRCHCFVLSSIAENSPCVIGEALCSGLPVIATSVGGVSELVNETNGKVIPSKDVEALVAAMVTVYNNYSTYNCQQIAEAASKKFGYSAIAEKFDELYRKFC